MAEHSSRVREAFKWISVRRQEEPGAKLFELVSEAARRFDLSPQEENEVFALLRSGQASGDAGGQEQRK